MPAAPQLFGVGEGWDPHSPPPPAHSTPYGTVCCTASQTPPSTGLSTGGGRLKCLIAKGKGGVIHSHVRRCLSRRRLAVTGGSGMC